jgi:DNA-binding NarL/FixJ family response regulator
VRDARPAVPAWIAVASASAGFVACLAGWLAGGGTVDVAWAPTLGLRLDLASVRASRVRVLGGGTRVGPAVAQAEVAVDPITVVLADDHALVRGGLRRLLDDEDDIRVIAEAANADQAIRVAHELRPRIVLLDVTMPGTPSIEAIPSLLDAAPGCAVVMLTMHDDAGFARDALAAGASGYVLKDAAERQLVDAVRMVVAGRGYLDPALGARSIAMPPAAPRTAVPSGTLEIGSEFAGHRVDGVAGRGGMGIVYRATDLLLGRRVALKLIAPGLSADPTFRARFATECRLAAAIDHPHAVEVFHAGEEDGLLYVTMRYVEGTDLRAVLRSERRMDPGRALRLIGHVAGALDDAHRRGLVHRDVKPGNVLVGRRDEEEHAFLTDFGLSKERAVASELTGTGLAIGTSDYIAPEQAQGREVDGRADIYALACVLYQCLAGAVPYERDSDIDKIWAHVHQPPPDLRELRPDLPAELSQVLLRGMAKDPGARPPTAGQFARAAVAATSS